MLHGLGARRRERLVDVRLERNALAAANAFVGRDHDGGGAVGDATRQRIGREAAEHDRVNRADARAREHRHGGLGNHRQVDRDAIALLHAEAAQRVGELADALVQLAIGDARRLVRIVAFVDERGLVAARRQVTVEAVVGDVELAVVEPADAEIAFVEADVLDLRVGLHPVEAAAHAPPERLRVAHRFGVGLLVVLLAVTGLARRTAPALRTVACASSRSPVLRAGASAAQSSAARTRAACSASTFVVRHVARVKAQVDAAVARHDMEMDVKPSSYCLMPSAATNGR